jgi:hypothetical protein
MNIEHFGLLSWVHESMGRHKTKNHAQDGRMLSAKTASASGDPAMVSGFRMASIPFASSHGHLARHAQRPDCCWTFESSMAISASCSGASPARNR